MVTFYFIDNKQSSVASTYYQDKGFIIKGCIYYSEEIVELDFHLKFAGADTNLSLRTIEVHSEWANMYNMYDDWDQWATVTSSYMLDTKIYAHGYTFHIDDIVPMSDYESEHFAKYLGLVIEKICMQNMIYYKAFVEIVQIAELYAPIKNGIKYGLFLVRRRYKSFYKWVQNARKRIAAGKKIALAIEEAYCNPNTQLCKKRLMNEFANLVF